jgi:hypothetical protein
MARYGLALVLTLLSLSARADFNWSAASWSTTVTSGTTGPTPNTASAGFTPSNTTSDMLSINGSAYAGLYSGGFGPTSSYATITFSRDFTIIGGPTTIYVRRDLTTGWSAGNPPGGGGGNFTLTCTGFTAFTWTQLVSFSTHPDDTIPLTYDPGTYTFSGQIDLSASRSSGNAGTSFATLNYGLAAVPEPGVLGLFGIVLVPLLVKTRTTRSISVSATRRGVVG